VVAHQGPARTEHSGAQGRHWIEVDRELLEIRAHGKQDKRAGAKDLMYWVSTCSI